MGGRPAVGAPSASPSQPTGWIGITRSG